LSWFELELQLALAELDEPPIIGHPLLCVHGSLEQLIAPISIAKNAAAISLFI
jgi:hypothetical protein